MSAAALPPPPAPDRTAHPFHMYDMIHEIPTAFRETLRRLSGPARDAAHRNADRSFLVFTGCGTASYAARLADHFAQSPSGRTRSAAVGAFELSRYGPRVDGSAAVIGISHSGITKTTVDALKYAREQGARTLGITHFEGRPITYVSDGLLIPGNGPDLSRCHTKCYVAGALAGALVGLEWRLDADRETRAALDRVREGLDALPADMDRVLRASEAPARELASELAGKGSVGIFGTGPNFPTAIEAALKLREASFIPALGMELEDFLHGSWQPTDADSVVFAVAPRGRSHDRAFDLIKAAHTLGARVVVVAPEDDPALEEVADTVFSTPPVDELLSPFLNIIPLYLYAYFASVAMGHNPDMLRYGDPKYWEARSFIFPPGTH